MINFILTSMDYYFFDSLSMRILFAFFTPLLLSILVGNKAINFLRKKQGKGQPIREDGPLSHLSKKGTPTMGGLLIIGTIFVSCLFWGSWNNIFFLTSLGALFIYAIIGYIDDYEKVTKQTSNAMSMKTKLILQFIVSLACVLIITYQTTSDISLSTSIPFYKNIYMNLYWFYIPFAMIVIVGTSNAVNLTDGLDGLATGLLAIIFAFFVIICLDKQYEISGTEEVAIICISVVGACIGFLWFNCYPAKIFMGDVGSLALGALLGTISVILKSEILLAFVGIIFVVEALSVMMQIFWFKKTGKRLFKMAPLHHHFEQKGMAETTIVSRCWIIALILAIIGLSGTM